MAFQLLQIGVIEAIQSEQITIHGGRAGLHASGLLQGLEDRIATLNESQEADLASLAACYAGFLIQDQPFLDNNLSTALLCTELVLTLNGHRLMADDSTCVLGFSVLANGDLSIDAFANWLRGHLLPVV